jgi:hypothetical protein
MNALRQHRVKLIAFALTFLVFSAVTPMVMAACTNCNYPNCCFGSTCVLNGHCVPGHPGCAQFDHLMCLNGTIICRDGCIA